MPAVPPGCLPTELPPLGLGTSENTDPETCTKSVRTALEAGYRPLDTAEGYGTEEYVGRGLGRANVDRVEVVVATKVLTRDGARYRPLDAVRVLAILL